MEVSLFRHYFVSFRDAPEATGDEPEDADFETPKVYELVRQQTLVNKALLFECGKRLCDCLFVCLYAFRREYDEI